MVRFKTESTEAYEERKLLPVAIKLMLRSGYLCNER